MRYPRNPEIIPSLKNDEELIKAVRMNIEICKRLIRLEQKRIDALREKLGQLTQDDR